jgi:hypothetical protein
MFFGHSRTVRALAAISYRFLRGAPHLIEQPSQSLVFDGFVAIFERQQPERHFE